MSIPNNPGPEVRYFTQTKATFALPRALLCISLHRAYISLHMLTYIQWIQSTALKGIVVRSVIRHMHAWPTLRRSGYRHPKCIRNLLSTYVSTQATSTEHISKDRDANQIVNADGPHSACFVFVFSGKNPVRLRWWVYWEYFWPPRMALKGKSSTRKRSVNTRSTDNWRYFFFFQMKEIWNGRGDDISKFGGEARSDLPVIVSAGGDWSNHIPKYGRDMTFILGIPLNPDGMECSTTLSTLLYVTLPALARKNARECKRTGITSIRSLTCTQHYFVYYGQNMSLSVQVQSAGHKYYDTNQRYTVKVRLTITQSIQVHTSASLHTRRKTFGKQTSEIHRLIDDQEAAVRQLLDNCALRTLYSARTPSVNTHVA